MKAAEHSTPTRVHTLVIGSGAAGLNAAIQLVLNGVTDILILTEGLSMGTSINTGSDKQTYYKLSLCGAEADSVHAMAETYFAGGGMHGDLALVEASNSARAFMHLVNLGMPFPRDEFGQFAGYKTDHDPRQRATSIGPYTSREMCRHLTREAQQLGIRILEDRCAIQLVTMREGDQLRVCGALALDESGAIETYLAENILFAVGGPGGLYQSSVYPEVHNGAIGLALMAGAESRNLPEFQYGLASTQFRWNVSGTYMQVIPRLVSLPGETEFLRPYFSSPAEMHGKVFLKGYQWPFDASKAVGGSSLIDILVYIETEIKGRRVYLDFRSNPDDFDYDQLPEEARQYLAHSNALQATPLERLMAMNPGAVSLYREHGIDLAYEPLEIAVCAQHNNGGLAGTLWWESTNIRHLFPIGEVNGSHGLRRPGGAALNAGQVGGFRAAEFIAHCYAGWSLDEGQAGMAIQSALSQTNKWIRCCDSSSLNWQAEQMEFRSRMSRVGAHIRSRETLEGEIALAWLQVERLKNLGCSCESPLELKQVFTTRQLCYAHAVYLDAILFAVRSGVGSRGSAIVLDSSGIPIHPLLGDGWSIQSEDDAYRNQVQNTSIGKTGRAEHKWMNRRPIPSPNTWFETTWQRFRSGQIYHFFDGETR